MFVREGRSGSSAILSDYVFLSGMLSEGLLR